MRATRERVGCAAAALNARRRRGVGAETVAAKAWRRARQAWPRTRSVGSRRLGERQELANYGRRPRPARGLGVGARGAVKKRGRSNEAGGVGWTTEQLTNEAAWLRLRRGEGSGDEERSQLEEQERRLEEAKAKAISEVVEEVTSSERKSARQAVLSIARRVRGKARAEASKPISGDRRLRKRIKELKKAAEQRVRDVEHEKDSER